MMVRLIESKVVVSMNCAVKAESSASFGILGYSITGCVKLQKVRMGASLPLVAPRAR